LSERRLSEKNIAPEDVAEVIVEGNPLVKVILNRPDPKDCEEARFSIYHGVSAAIIDRDVNHRSFLKAQDPRFVEMRHKVKVRIDADVNAKFKAGVDSVTIRLKDGTQHRGEFTTYKGEKGFRFTREEVTGKYREYAGELLTADELDKVKEVVLELEKCSDLSSLLHILTFPGKLSKSTTAVR
jgi:2-methylcitrate dehydratase PrpD